MTAKEEKILASLEHKNKMLTMDEVSEIIGEDLHNTFTILEDLCRKGKISRIYYDECLFWSSEETALAFEKKIKELDAEFGLI